YFDARADRGSIAFHPDQFQINPIIAVSRILEETKGVSITGNCAAREGKNVLIAIAINVGERDAVAFVEFAGTGRRGNVSEIFSIVIAKQHMRNQRGVIRITASDIHIQKAVVIDVGEICSHGHSNLIEMSLGSYVFECTIS